MFVTLRYKGWDKPRDESETLTGYIKDWEKFYQGHLKIKKAELVSENCTSRLNDGYATGNKYRIEGEVERFRTLEQTRFHLYHSARNDYFCSEPVLYNSIKWRK